MHATSEGAHCQKHATYSMYAYSTAALKTWQLFTGITIRSFLGLPAQNCTSTVWFCIWREMEEAQSHFMHK